MSNLQTKSGTHVGWWSGPAASVHSASGNLAEGLARIGRPLYLLDEALELRVGETSPPAAFAPDEEEQFGPD